MDALPSKGWKETIAADESERFESHAARVAAMQRNRDAAATAKGRALHVKSHGGARAELRVLADLPEHARVALFAEPKTYAAYVRFSNGGAANQGDDKPDLRGIAIKLLGVPGRKLIPGMEDETTQDFLLINTPSLPFSSVEDFITLVTAAASPLTLPFKLFAHFGFGTFGFLKRLLATTKPVASLATVSYFTVAPVRFGDYAVRVSLAPAAANGEAKREGATLAADLASRLGKGDLAWDLRVQFFVDEEKTPIEDLTRVWSESDSPPLVVARLTIPKQDLDSVEGQRLAREVDAMAFDPWHACEELRPLSASMRARGPAYRESQKNRSAAREPKSA